MQHSQVAPRCYAVLFYVAAVMMPAPHRYEEEEEFDGVGGEVLLPKTLLVVGGATPLWVHSPPLWLSSGAPAHAAHPAASTL